MIFRTAILSFYLVLLTTAISAEDGATPLQCGDATTAEVIDVSSNFTSLRTGAVCENGYCGDFLAPKELHWHVYVTPQNTQPRQFVQPEGLLTPTVRNGVLSYTLQDVLEDYDMGDRIQAGIFLWIPQDMLESIEIAGVDQYVQIHADSDDDLASIERELTIVSGAVDSHIVVNSPYWAVDLAESGVDNQIYIDAAAGSTVDVAGVDTEVYIRCPSLSSLVTRGVDNEVFVEGTVVLGSLEGVDGDVEINNNGGVSSSNTNPCANITTSGVDNHCDDTDDVLEIGNLSCLADTKVGYYGGCSWTHLSTGAQVGIVIGSIALLAAIITASIFCCCRRGCCCKDQRSSHDFKGTVVTYPVPVPPPPMHSFANQTVKSEDGTHATVTEAEVLEVKDTMATNDFENVDLEKAKQDPVHVY